MVPHRPVVIVQELLLRLFPCLFRVREGLFSAFHVHSSSRHLNSTLFRRFRLEWMKWTITAMATKPIEVRQITTRYCKD